MALSARSVSSSTSSRTVCRRLARFAVRQRAHDAHGAVVHEIVDAGEFAGQELVVVAEFEQLRVGVFEELDDGLGARRGSRRETRRSS